MNSFHQISYNGLSESGGVERVAFYVNETLKNSDTISVQSFWFMRILKNHFPRVYAKFGWIFFSIIASLYCQNRGLRTISHGFQCAFYPNEIVFAHGTMAGFLKATAHIRKARLGFLYRWFERSAFTKAKKVIAVCERVKQELIQFYDIPANKITVVHNCVDTKRFHPASNSPTGPLRVLFVGRLEQAKGLSALLGLANEIDLAAAEGVEGAELRVISAGKQNTELFRGFRQTTIVNDLNIDQMALEYQKADILIVPSIYEGFEMITLEALASGLKVLARPVGAAATLAQATTDPNERPWPIFLNDFADPKQMLGLVKQIGRPNSQEREYTHLNISRFFSFQQFQEKLLDVLKES